MAHRTLADEVDDLAKVSFKLPPDALKPAADAQKGQTARAQESPAQPEGSAAGKCPTTPLPPHLGQQEALNDRELWHDKPSQLYALH